MPRVDDLLERLAPSDVTECPAEHSLDPFETVDVDVAQRIPVRIRFQLAYAVHLHAMVAREQINTGNVDLLTVFPEPPVVLAGRADRRGLHENLYPKGLSLHSGAGSPPQYDLKWVTLPPRFLTSSMIRIADMWSIPGSTPISLRIITPASRAGPSRAFMVGLTYEVVTMCFLCLIHISATTG